MEDNSKNSPPQKIIHWNSSENPIIVNSIRYNQDLCLLILGTSKGYKIFCSSTFKSVGEDNEVITKFGDIHFADLYYSSNLVFLLPSKYNNIYKDDEIIIFNDYFQNKIGSFKIKNDTINNFFICNDIIFIITFSKIIILELYSLRIIDIIENISYNDKIISCNYLNYLAYTTSVDPTTIHIVIFKKENNILLRKKQKITANFGFIQVIQFSPSGDQIVISSIFGNKIHIYNTNTGELKNCFFLGTNIQTIEKILFSEKKPNYLLFIKRDKSFNVYKIGKAKEKGKIQKCICNIDNDQDLLSRVCEIEQKNAGLSKPRSYSKNKNITEPHAYSNFEQRLLFGDFDRTKHKDLLFIDRNGKLIKYHFNKKKNGKISPTLSSQWF